METSLSVIFPVSDGCCMYVCCWYIYNFFYTNRSRNHLESDSVNLSHQNKSRKWSKVAATLETKSEAAASHTETHQFPQSDSFVKWFCAESRSLITLSPADRSRSRGSLTLSLSSSLFYLVWPTRTSQFWPIDFINPAVGSSQSDMWEMTTKKKRLHARWKSFDSFYEWIHMSL